MRGSPRFESGKGVAQGVGGVNLAAELDGAWRRVDAGRFRVLDLPEGSVRVLRRWSRGQISPVVTGGD